MLSDSEQCKSSAIERQLRSDDPEFVAGFLQRAHRSVKWYDDATRAWINHDCCDRALALVNASTGITVRALGCAGVTLVLWLTDDRRDATPRRPRRQ
jgi:hypothetical protein